MFYNKVIVLISIIYISTAHVGTFMLAYYVSSLKARNDRTKHPENDGKYYVTLFQEGTFKKMNRNLNLSEHKINTINRG